MFLIQNNFIQNIGQSLGSLLNKKTTPTFSVGGNFQLSSVSPAPAPSFFISDQVQSLITKPVSTPAPYFISEQIQTLISSSTVINNIVNQEPSPIPIQFPVIRPLVGSPSNGFFTPPQSTYNEVKTPIVYIAPPPPLPAAPPIDIFLSKIRFSTPFYNSDEISDILTELISDDELLKAVFALEKAHFSAIVYLAVERLVDGEDIRALVEMRYETRNDLLLNYLKREAEDIYVFRNFFKIMSNLMANPISKTILPVENDISVPNINSLMNDELYTYARSLITKYQKEDPFSQAVLPSVTFSQEAAESLGYTATIEEEASVILDMRSSGNKNRVMSSKRLFNSVFNYSYPIILNKLYTNRLVSDYSIPESDINLLVKTGGMQAATPSPFIPNYFLKLSEAYGLSSVMNPQNLLFITDNMLKSVLDKVFPNGDYFNRSSEFYMGKRLVSFDQSINTYDELSYGSVNKDSLHAINLALNNNHIIAKDSGEVLSFGKKNYTRLMINTLFDAMRESSLENYAYDQIDKLTFTQITSYLDTVKSSVEDFIDDSFESGIYTESETLFMLFFKDIFSQYIDYLKNNNIISEFKPTLSTSGINNYKLLNMVQQTFIFLPELIRRILANQQYVTLEKTLFVGYNEASASSYVRYLRGIQL
jgi:hypothetical protein